MSGSACSRLLLWVLSPGIRYWQTLHNTFTPYPVHFFFCGLRRQSVVCKFELQSVVHGTGEAYTPETAMLGDEPSSSCLLMEHRPHNRLHVPCKRLLLSQLRSSLITQNKQLRHELHAKTNKVHSERLQVFHHI